MVWRQSIRISIVFPFSWCFLFAVGGLAVWWELRASSLSSDLDQGTKLFRHSITWSGVDSLNAGWMGPSGAWTLHLLTILFTRIWCLIDWSTGMEALRSRCGPNYVTITWKPTGTSPWFPHQTYVWLKIQEFHHSCSLGTTVCVEGLLYSKQDRASDNNKKYLIGRTGLHLWCMLWPWCFMCSKVQA